MRTKPRGPHGAGTIRFVQKLNSAPGGKLDFPAGALLFFTRVEHGVGFDLAASQNRNFRKKELPENDCFQGVPDLVIQSEPLA